MRAAFVAAGGNVKLVTLDALGNGHDVMLQIAGRSKWLPELDAFLRARGLPTWQAQDVDKVLQKFRFNSSQRPFIETYMSAPTEKALGRSTTTDYATFSASQTLDDARRHVQRSCQAKGQVCAIAMEDDRWIGP